MFCVLRPGTLRFMSFFLSSYSFPSSFYFHLIREMERVYSHSIHIATKLTNHTLKSHYSPVCCIYHKPRRFDESSSESSDSSSGDDDSGPDSDSDSGRAQPGGRLRNHRHNHNHSHNHSRRSHHDHRDCGDGHAEGGSTRSTSRNGGGGGGVVESIDPDKPDVNAYEKQPKSRKGKAVG